MGHPGLRPGRAVSVGVDARGLYATGVGRYVREVLAGMLVDPRFAGITLLGDPDELHAFVAEHGAADRMPVLQYAASWFTRRTQTAWLSLWRRGCTRADVWFFPFGDVPLLAHPNRSVATIHDLIVLKVSPELSRMKDRLATRVMLRGAVRHARRVITVSEATRRDIVEHIPSAAHKAVVVHQGVGRDFSPLVPGEPLLPRVAGLRPFLLCVGRRAPHKNQVGAIEALARVRAVHPDLRLVFAGGGSDPAWTSALARARELGVAEAVVDFGHATDAQLRHLYAGCEALLFPSLYEGFGLPPLEAMACGAPVIASDRSSVPEVVGDAGFLMDPHDAAAMAEAVLQLARTPALRAELGRRGRERAAQFSWEATARRTAELVYQSAIG